jgi:hypothetical protein
MNQPTPKKTKSVADVNKELKLKHNTLENTFEMFPVGIWVQVICACRDFRFFKGDEVGQVIRNTGNYLGIIVKFSDGLEFNFAPEDLIILNKEGVSQPTPLWSKTLDKAVEEWILQGRSDEQIHGVKNFLSGKGGTAIENLIQEVINDIPDEGFFPTDEPRIVKRGDILKQALRAKYGRQDD